MSKNKKWDYLDCRWPFDDWEHDVKSKSVPCARKNHQCECGCTIYKGQNYTRRFWANYSHWYLEKRGSCCEPPEIVHRERETKRPYLVKPEELKPLQTRVDYRSIIGGKVTLSNALVRSKPWQLGDGEWVVMIKGKAGGVSLRAITISKETANGNV